MLVQDSLSPILNAGLKCIMGAALAQPLYNHIMISQTFGQETSRHNILFYQLKWEIYNFQILQPLFKTTDHKF